MAHKEQVEFCKYVKRIHEYYFSNVFVLDAGSLDINGNNQYLFTDSLYIGVDVGQGKNVDITQKIHELSFPESTFDVIISTEVFEHDLYYVKSIANLYRMLKPGGLLLITCATTGRPEHGTRRTSPKDAPLLQGIDGWLDYYKNLTEKDFREILDIDESFKDYSFTIEENHKDLNFWGLKKGELDKNLGLSCSVEGSISNQKNSAHEKIIEEKLIKIREMSNVLAIKNESIVERDRILDIKRKEISLLNQEKNKTYDALTLKCENEKQSIKDEFSLSLQEKQSIIDELLSLLQDKQSIKDEFSLSLREKQSIIDELSSLLQEKQSIIDELSSLLQEKQSIIDELGSKVIDLSNKNQSYIDQVKVNEEILQKKESLIKNQTAKIREMSNVLAIKNENIVERDRVLDIKRKEISLLNNRSKLLEKEIASKNQEIKQLLFSVQNNRLEKESLMSELLNVHRSFSWKITRYLRRFRRALKI